VVEVDNLYGLEIIRAYELSWLNPNGKPQLGVLEIAQDFAKPSVDTWKLKSFLESINNKIYENIDLVKKDICACVNLDNVRIVTQENFAITKYFEQIIPPNSGLKISIGLRFICHETSQPYIGTVNIITNDDNVFKKTEINNIVNSFRNMKFTPKVFVKNLFKALCEQTMGNFILSVHLNRRGGISYQALCSKQLIDFSEFCHRSILE
jgi:hypothetical protein